MENTTETDCVEEIGNEATSLTSPSNDTDNHKDGFRYKAKQITSRMLRYRLLVGLTLGQVLALLQSGSSVFTQILQSSPPGPFHAPNAQYFCTSLTLSTIFTLNLARQPRCFRRALLYRGFAYFLVAFLDAEAAYLILLSFQYTTLTSVNLLQSFVIVSAALTSTLFLSVKYKIEHVMGIALSLTGIIVLLLVDVKDENPFGTLVGSEQKRLIGDCLVLLASIFYGISNVSTEVLTRKYGLAEFLGMHQLFAVLISGTQVCILEREAILTVSWNINLVLFIFAYVIVSVLFVTLLATVIKYSSATAMNVSLITTNFYNLVFASIIFHFEFSWLYMIGFFTLISAQILFYLKTPGKNEKFGVLSWWRLWKAKRSNFRIS